ncbi:MAG: ATP-binding protein [Myxococcales bacterium]|nr:ATP-binding protein [Myxococcales bacterium]
MGELFKQDPVTSITRQSLAGEVTGTNDDRGRPRFITVAGPQRGRVFPVEADMVIGRSSTAGASIDDGGLSRTHARVAEVAPGSFLLEDVGSTNGTYVNGERITRHILRPGDEVQLGPRVVLMYVMPDPEHEQLLKVQRLEAMGRMTAGISHDFNNLLTVLAATCGSLRELEPSARLDSADVSECLQDIELAVGRARALAKRLGSFARQDDDAMEVIDLAEVCREVGQLLRRMLPAEIRLDLQLEVGVQVEGNRTRLHQMIMNPAINAMHAMTEGGDLLLRVGRVQRGGTEAGGGGGADESQWAVIEIVDTGVGMDAKTLERCRDAFFTTKGRGTGSGLGLATVERVAREHGGELTLDSELGRGTTVRVVLPLAQGRRRHAGSTTTMTSVPETAIPLASDVDVVIAEADAIVARSAGRLLEATGYGVRYARTEEELLAKATGHGRPVRLVLLDADLPPHGALSAFNSLRRRLPEARVIFASTEAEPVLKQLAISAGARGFVSKPLDGASLRRAVQLALLR